MAFSIIGLLISLSILAPNLLILLFPPRNVPQGIRDAGVLFTILERAGQAGCFVLPALLGSQFNRAADLWFVLMVLCLLAYWALWARYAARGREFRLLFQPLWLLPVPMAVFPVLAFGLAAVWGQSVWLGIATAALATGHLVNSWNTYSHIK